MKNVRIDANGTEVRIIGNVLQEDAYISLTDIAKYRNPDNAFTLTPQEMSYTYASEADILNVALFGKTAAQWRNEQSIEGKTGEVSSCDILYTDDLEKFEQDYLKYSSGRWACFGYIPGKRRVFMYHIQCNGTIHILACNKRTS